MNRFLAVLALLGSLALPCHADVIRWQLQGVTFADGATATGFFDFESTTRTTINWDIVTSAGTAPGDPFVSAFEYTPGGSRATSNGLDANMTLIAPIAGAPRHTLSFVFVAPITAAAAFVPLATGSLEGFVPAATAFTRFTSAGGVTAVPVPEPASWFTLVAGLGWLVLRRRRAAR